MSPWPRTTTRWSRQYIMTTLEELGLLKMDFLGLRNLTVLDDAVRLVRQQPPGLPALGQIPEDDPETFEMLSEGQVPPACSRWSPPA